MSGRVIQRYGFGKRRLFGVPLYTWDVAGMNSIQRCTFGRMAVVWRAFCALDVTGVNSIQRFRLG